MPATGVVIMPDETLPYLESELADTVAYYVKQGLRHQGFFRRKMRNRWESTFSIHTAENQGMPVGTHKTS